MVRGERKEREGTAKEGMHGQEEKKGEWKGGNRNREEQEERRMANY